MPMTRSKGATDSGFAGTLGLGVLALSSMALVWHVAGLDIDIRPMPQPNPRQSGAPTAPLGGNAPTPAVALVPRPLSAFSGTLERPLFEPSRRPRPAVVEPVEPVAAAADEAVATAADGLRIVGIMRAKGGAAVARALVRSSDAPQAVWVETGASIGGWKVASIGDRTVTVENGRQRREISLFAPASADRPGQ